MLARSSHDGGTTIITTDPIRASTGSHRRSLQPAPIRTITKTDPIHKRGNNGGKVTLIDAQTRTKITASSLHSKSLETLKYSKMYKSILSNFDVGLSQIELRISASLQFQEACTTALEIADLDKLITRHDELLWRRENELL